MKTLILCTLAALALPVSVRAQTVAQTPENYDSWPRLRSEFPSTGGGDIVIKGYDPVIVGGKCVPDFSAHTPDGKAHYNVVEFEIVAVAGTDYDFTAARPVHGAQHTLYDINYVLRGPSGELRHAATLTSRGNGLSMELWTTEPGVQFYDGHLIDMPVEGLDGTRYGRHAGLCLEPQRFPDSPNKAHFSESIVRPGRVSQQVSELRFSR